MEMLGVTLPRGVLAASLGSETDGKGYKEGGWEGEQAGVWSLLGVPLPVPPTSGLPQDGTTPLTSGPA